MPTLYVRDFPDDLHCRVKERAASNRRSLSAEVVVLVDEALKHTQAAARSAEALRRIARRRRNSGVPAGSLDSLSLLREDRDR